MTRIETTKRINLAQLSVELGRVGLKMGDGYIEADVDRATLQAKIDAHSANDAWVDPDPAPTPPTPRDVARAKVQSIQAGPIRDALVALLDAI